MTSNTEDPRRPTPPVDETAPAASADRHDLAPTDGRYVAPAAEYDTSSAAERHAVYQGALAREQERFGGFKFGSAFFGWLTATGTAVLLTALLAAIGAGIGLDAGNIDEAADAAAQDSVTAGIVGAIVLALVLLISYFAGGYVAGRMARFSGMKQGIAVWIWSIAIAVVVAIVTAIAGSQWEILGTLDSLPRIPVTAETATITGIITALVAAVVALIGAVLGGMTGMRYHRRVDRVGLGR